MDRIHLAVVILALMATLFGLEQLSPLRRRRRPLLGRLLLNFGLSTLSFLTALALVRPAAIAALHWTSSAPFGLVHLVPMPPAARLLLSFLLMDLTFYWWHVANHRIPFLWRFHNVHHIDPDLDVSTAFRFHFGEVAFSAAFRAVQVGLIGLSAGAFAFYEVVFQVSTLFHHSNLRLPERLERRLNALLVTPRMHGIHHSDVREHTNSNYSVVLSCWDRLHRTLGLDVPQSQIVIGVPAYSDAKDNTPLNALLLPFRPQRDYWRR
jgi:sterol desaturase/sphingolipid hydroxylase (fatty acid hydroxylase superfamily)